MYITLKSIKRNLVIGALFILVFTILFVAQFYTMGIVVISTGFISLVPLDFSKCNRMYKLFLLFGKFMIKDKNYYFYNE